MVPSEPASTLGVTLITVTAKDSVVIVSPSSTETATSKVPSFANV